MHNSKLIARAGDKVVASQLIALFKALPDQPVAIRTTGESSFECVWGNGNSSLPFFHLKYSASRFTFTSGTTERARAVVLTEGSLCASAACGSALLPLSGNDTLLCMLPLDHVFGFVCGLLWGLSSGAAVATTG